MPLRKKLDTRETLHAIDRCTARIAGRALLQPPHAATSTRGCLGLRADDEALGSNPPHRMSRFQKQVFPESPARESLRSSASDRDWSSSTFASLIGLMCHCVFTAGREIVPGILCGRMTRASARSSADEIPVSAQSPHSWAKKRRKLMRTPDCISHGIVTGVSFSK